MKNGTKLETIPERVTYLMYEFKYDEGSFAHRLGVSPTAVKNVIKLGKNPSLTMLQNITKILPVHEDWLFVGKGPKWTESKIDSYKNGSKELTKHRDVDTGISARMRQIRDDSGLSQAVFSGNLGCTRDVISAIEIEKTSPSANLISALMDNYNINPIWLIKGVGDKNWKKK